MTNALLQSVRDIINGSMLPALWKTSWATKRQKKSFRTHTHTQEESFVTSGTHQATGRCRLASFLQSSENLSLGTCICSGRVLCPRVVPQRSHKTHRCTSKRVDVRCHWLPTKHTLLLSHSIWHYVIWDKAQCFMLEALQCKGRFKCVPQRLTAHTWRTIFLYRC